MQYNFVRKKVGIRAMLIQLEFWAARLTSCHRENKSRKWDSNGLAEQQEIRVLSEHL